MAGRLGLTLGVVNFIILIFLISSMGGEEDVGKSLAVDKVAFDYINVIEEDGYLTDATRMNIISELSDFDEVDVVGTKTKVDKGQSVNLTIKVKDEGSLFKKEKSFSREMMLNGVAR